MPVYKREFLHKDNQVDPGKEDHYDAYLSLPVVQAEAVSVADPHKHYGGREGEHFKQIHLVLNVFKTAEEELVGLHQQSCQCQEHNDNCSNEQEPVVSSTPVLVVHKLCMEKGTLHHAYSTGKPSNLHKELGWNPPHLRWGFRI